MSYKDDIKLFTWVGVLSGVFAALLLAVVLILPFWLLWNWVAPIFSLQTLTIIQAWGLYLLIQLLRVPNMIKEIEIELSTGNNMKERINHYGDDDWANPDEQEDF